MRVDYCLLTDKRETTLCSTAGRGRQASARLDTSLGLRVTPADFLSEVSLLPTLLPFVCRRRVAGDSYSD